MTRKQRRMQRAVKYLQHYVAEYSNQTSYTDYSDETLIDDMLYGLGVALEPEQHRFAAGYEAFKEKIRAHLNAD